MVISDTEGYIHREVESFITDQTRDIPVICDIEVNRSGEGKTYFSEIEITLWHQDNILDVISIPVYSQGKLRDNQQNLIDWFNKEYLKSIKKIHK